MDYGAQLMVSSLVMLKLIAKCVLNVCLKFGTIDLAT